MMNDKQKINTKNTANMQSDDVIMSSMVEMKKKKETLSTE